MKNLKALLYCFIILACALPAAAQESDGGRISGNLETNANFFIRDSLL